MLVHGKRFIDFVYQYTFLTIRANFSIQTFQTLKCTKERKKFCYDLISGEAFD